SLPRQSVQAAGPGLQGQVLQRNYRRIESMACCLIVSAKFDERSAARLLSVALMLVSVSIRVASTEFWIEVASAAAFGIPLTTIAWPVLPTGTEIGGFMIEPPAT